MRQTKFKKKTFLKYLHIYKLAGLSVNFKLTAFASFKLQQYYILITPVVFINRSPKKNSLFNIITIYIHEIMNSDQDFPSSEFTSVKRPRASITKQKIATIRTDDAEVIIIPKRILRAFQQKRHCIFMERHSIRCVYVIISENREIAY